MLVFSDKIFESLISGTGTVYTDMRFAEELAYCENVALFARAEIASGTNPTLTLQFENSFDGTRWQNRAATPELNAGVLTVGPATETSFFAGSAYSAAQQYMRYCRIRITLGGTSPAVFLLLYADGRNPYYCAV